MDRRKKNLRFDRSIDRESDLSNDMVSGRELLLVNIVFLKKKKRHVLTSERGDRDRSRMDTGFSFRTFFSEPKYHRSYVPNNFKRNLPNEFTKIYIKK